MPDTTSLYRLFNHDGHLLYIGIGSNPGRRFDNHNSTKRWWDQVTNITVEHHPTRADALAAERAAIQAEHPQHNIVHNGHRPNARQFVHGKVGWGNTTWWADIYDGIYAALWIQWPCGTPWPAQLRELNEAYPADEAHQAIWDAGYDGDINTGGPMCWPTLATELDHKLADIARICAKYPTPRLGYDIGEMAHA